MTEPTTIEEACNRIEKHNYCCHKCFIESVDGWPFPSKMILCPTCDNKRCPKATDHNLVCTGSNEPGQPGSRY